MNKPLVSILMPVYNGLPLIKASIQSVLDQTYQNWECIIVDDGSNDGTSEYLDTLSDDRFIIHHFETNQGRPYARQKTLELSSGEYLAMLDAEDLMAPRRLEEQIKELDENPEIELVSSCMLSFGTMTNTIRVRGSEKKEIVQFNGKNFPNHASSMMRARSAKLIKYNPMMKLGQDTDFLARYLVGKKYMNLPVVHYYYSEFDSVTRRKIRKSYKYAFVRKIKSKNCWEIITYLPKVVYANILLPFVPIEWVLLRRGRPASCNEEEDYANYCKQIINKFSNGLISD